MNAQLGPEIITSYKRLSYTPWHALAEFVDNSTQAFMEHKEELVAAYKVEQSFLSISINYLNDEQGEYLIIQDNSIGMSAESLEKAVIIGKSPSQPGWRSKYGLGLKTAACWFGDFWTVQTKRLGENASHYVEFDVNRVANGDMDLRYKRFDANPEEHYTIITIRQLNKLIRGRTKGKIRDHLMSIYRIDISNDTLEIIWDDQVLNWNYEEMIFSRLLSNHNGERIKRDFDFLVDGKKVKGWAGVFESGSRADAGFSLIQADRVIKGWPDSFRPASVFGEQVGGRNDLINQRIVGEIFLDGFDISHTKDEVLFTDEQIASLEEQLLENIGDLKNIALTFRKYEADNEKADENDEDIAIAELLQEVDSFAMKEVLRNFIPAPPEELHQANAFLTNRVTRKSKPSLKVQIEDLTILLYIEPDMSPNDPYVINDSTSSKSTVIIIVNRSHPHWNQIIGLKAATNFLRHCIYDGVAEWRCYQRLGTIQPDTVKKYKDCLLRVPFEIEQSEKI